jgi:hypothetical protein
MKKIKFLKSVTFSMTPSREIKCLTLTQKLVQQMPTFDGHFWVEKDGVIIDNDFSDDDKFIRAINNTTKEKKYHEAPVIVQNIFIGMVEKTLNFELQKMKLMCEGNDIEELSGKELKQFLLNVLDTDRDKELKAYEPTFEFCPLNAYKNWKEHGGRLVFGSQGYVKNKGGVWWEYGNPEWTKVSDFMK